MNNLSKETSKELEKLVERVVKKSGFATKEITFEKYINDKKNKSKDFKEEIKTYLYDSILDLMEDGMTESDALSKTTKQFDMAELMPEMETFMKEFNDFGMELDEEWYAKHGAVGSFYGGFIILGITLGTLIGFLTTGTILSCLIGAGFGLFIGVGLGLISQGIISTKSLKKYNR